MMFLKTPYVMSNDNVFERLYKQQATIGKLVVDGKRDPKAVSDILQGIIEGRENGQSKSASGNPYLRRLYESDRILIPVTGGQRLIHVAKDVFRWGINGDFKNWGLTKKAGNAPETEAHVYELYSDGTFAQFFGSFGQELDKLCFTQDQIIAFCETNKDKLRRDGCANFFLMKQDDKFFVARVDLDDDGYLCAYVYQFEYDYVWFGEDQHRVVVPATVL